MPLTLDLVQTVAFAGVLLFIGYGVRNFVPGLARVNIPAPVCGGLPSPPSSPFSIFPVSSR